MTIRKKHRNSFQKWYYIRYNTFCLINLNISN